MFTGIVTDIGRVEKVEPAGDTKFVIASRYDSALIAIGASICCSGVCLTVVARGPRWFETDLAVETLRRSALGARKEGARVNLERALRLGDRLGGHLVQGHVDGVADLLEVRPEGDGKRICLAAPGSLTGYIVEKGSVALDGVSLTVAFRDEQGFEVALIPHTLAATTLGEWSSPRQVNLEVDLMAKYVESLLKAWQKPESTGTQVPSEKET